MRIWVDTLVGVGEDVRRGVLFDADEHGTIRSVHDDHARPDDAVVLGVAAPGFANAHSHAFHRALRGRAHQSGSFWTWRELMYRAAGALTPERYRAFAAAVFSEMVLSGWTAVGEFHYVHHRPDGSPYPDHAMEIALADAAAEAGIRLVLLDTCYLSGGIDRGLSAAQTRFGDGDAAGWLTRWHALRATLEGRHPRVSLGAALHSVRAVPRTELAAAATGIPAGVPLHIHLSEQPAENGDCLAAHGLTPTGVLAAEGVLSPRLSVVHATHLTDEDRALLGAAGVTAVFCPTTEADLGDGIGPAVELLEAGVALAVGSDQNAVVDPLRELHGLEAGERLRSLKRGRILPERLWEIGTTAGYAALGLGPVARVGGPLDLVELDPCSVRTAGARPAQLALVATSADVRRTIVAGRVVSHDPAAVAARLEAAIAALMEEDG